jgi:alpha-galactosidase
MNRRHFIKTTGLSIAATVVYRNAFSASNPEGTSKLSLPDEVSAIVNNTHVTLVRSGDFWIYEDVAVSFESAKDVMTVFIEAPNVSLSAVMLKWKTPIDTKATVLNDQWERTYGDASWHAQREGEQFPWYFIEANASGTNGFGIKTGAKSFCAWNISNCSLGLTLDTRSGGNGVKLDKRKIKAAELVSITSKGQ